MRKWDVLITANDGQKFYQNVHVIESNPESASAYVQENFPDHKIRQTVKIEKIELIEEAELFLPGIVYKSGRAYFQA